MSIKVERQGTDSVKISADDRRYYTVNFRPFEQHWEVELHYSGVIAAGETIGTYSTAQEAVSFVRSMLSERGDELTEALKH